MKAIEYGHDMNPFSRREWKKWAYGKLRTARTVPKTRVYGIPAPESEYPGWLLPILLVAIVFLILVYVFLL
jgi:hypothetical protein